ncbi:MAG TPA: hypothetical protein PLG12_12145, partial [Verrucomicrobiota bacterium]|jgi:hypothetical protein|nr:hypothetical protein [Verrucomicrobiota bacterium]
VSFKSRRPVENGFARAAIEALVAFSRVFDALEPDVPIVVGEVGDAGQHVGVAPAECKVGLGNH